MNEVGFRLHGVCGSKVQGGVQLYHIQWEHYPDVFNRWEVEANLGDQVFLVREYEERKLRTGSGAVRNPVGIHRLQELKASKRAKPTPVAKNNDDDDDDDDDGGEYMDEKKKKKTTTAPR